MSITIPIYYKPVTIPPLPVTTTIITKQKFSYEISGIQNNQHLTLDPPSLFTFSNSTQKLHCTIIYAILIDLVVIVLWRQ